VEVRSIYTAAKFSDLDAGEGFFFGINPFYFAIRVVDDQQKAGMLSFQDFGDANLGPNVYLSSDDLPSTVLRVHGLTIRTEKESLSLVDTGYGSILSVGSQFYIRSAYSGVNVSSGKLEKAPNSRPIYFKKWSAGVIWDEKWVPLFEF
jgi:hypothetical protein